MKQSQTIRNALSRYPPNPACSEFIHPHGGLFLWLKLSARIDTNRLLESSKQKRVMLAPGSSFFCDEKASRSHLRLNFASHTPPKIVSGLKKIAQAYREL